MRFLDDAKLTGKVRETKDGYLAVSALVARTGIQEYLGSEMGRDEDVVRVYRPESEVFSKDSLATFVGKPITDNHPQVPVTSRNWKDYARGSIGEEVLRDGEYIRVSLALMDEDLIQKVVDGKREISMGYDMQLDFTPGETPNGEAYDAIMTNLSMNHAAIVDRGRAGPAARIGDSWTDTKPKSTRRKRASKTTTKNTGDSSVTLKVMVVDGIGSVETTEEGIQAIKSLQDANKQAVKDAAKEAQAAKDKHEAAINTLKSTHDKAIADKDTELAAKDAEIDKLKKAQLSDEALDQRVMDRSELLTKATALVKDGDFKGKSDLEIKTAVVTSVRGADALAGKSDAYIEAAFDLCEVKANDSFATAMQNRSPVVSFDAASGGKSESQLEYEANARDAWKAPQFIAGSQ